MTNTATTIAHRVRKSKYLVCCLSVGLLLSCAAVNAQSNNALWASPSSDSYSASAVSINGTSSTQLDALTDRGQSSIQLTQFLDGGNALAMRYSQAVHQRDLALGYSIKDLTVSYMSGSGEDFAELGGQYAGIDPYLFHGGWKQQFNYDGFAFDYALGTFGHMQYGEATMQSAGLQDRNARYLEWSNQSLFARATRFSRGGEAIGNGFDAGIAFGNKHLAIQAMELDDNRSMQRMRLQIAGKHSREYWLDVSAHHNELYRDNDDVQVMFTFKTLLGARSLASYFDEGEAETTGAEAESTDDPDAAPAPKKKKKWVGRALLIGVGVAAAAGGSSSGSAAADTMARFRTQHSAALDVLNGINPTSIRENREYGGWVFANPDGSFASTLPVKGEVASVQLPNRAFVIPSGSAATASYHTHAAFHPRFDNENFSPQDLQNDRDIGVDGYLATPAGQFKYHDVANDLVLVLGTVATSD